MKSTGLSEIHAKTAFLMAAAGVAASLPEPVTGIILAGVGYLTNRLSSKADAKERAALPTWQELQINGHLARLAAEATTRVLEEIRETPSCMKHYNEQWLRAMIDRAEAGWLECMSLARVGGQDLTNLIARQTTRGARVDAFDPEDWRVFTHYILPHQGGGHAASSDFIEEVSGLLRERFTTYFYELAKKSGERDPATHAALMFHFFGALVEGQRVMDAKLDGLETLIKETRVQAVFATHKLSAPQARMFGTLMKTFTEKVDGLEDVLRELPEHINISVREGLREEVVPVMQQEAGLTRQEIRNTESRLSRKSVAIFAVSAATFIVVLLVLWRQNQQFELTRQLVSQYNMDKAAHQTVVAAGLAGPTKDYRQSYAVRLGLGIDDLDDTFKKTAHKLYKDAVKTKERALSTPGGVTGKKWYELFKKYSETEQAALAGNDVDLRYTCLEELYRIARIVGVPELQVEILTKKAGMLREQARPEMALEQYETAANVAWRSRDIDLWVGVMSDLIDQLRHMGRISAAKARAQGMLAVATSKRLKNPTTLCHALVRQADVLDVAGDTVAAEKMLSSAIEMHLEKCAVPDCGSTANFKLRRAQLLNKLGRQDEAEKLLDEFAATLPADDIVVLDLRFHFALARYQKMQIAGIKAEDEGRRALDLAWECHRKVAKDRPEDFRQHVVTMGNIATTQRVLGQGDAALATLDNEIKRVRVARGENTREELMLEVQRAEMLLQESDRPGWQVNAEQAFENLSKRTASLDVSDALAIDILEGHLSCLSASFRFGEMRVPLDEMRRRLGKWPAHDRVETRFGAKLWEAVVSSAEGRMDKASAIMDGIKTAISDGQGDDSKTRAWAVVELLSTWFDTIAGKAVDAGRLPVSADDADHLDFMRARICLLTGHAKKAIPMLEGLLAKARRNPAGVAKNLLLMEAELGRAYRDEGRFTEAAAILSRVRMELVARRGRWSLQDCHAAGICTEADVADGRMGEAAPLLRDVIQGYSRLPEGSVDLAVARINLSLCQIAESDWAGAEQSALPAVEALKDASLAHAVVLLQALECLAKAQRQLGRSGDDMRLLLDGAGLVLARDVPAFHPNGYRLWRLSDDLILMGQPQLARQLLEKAIKIDTELFTDRSLAVARNLNLIGCAEEALKLPEDALGRYRNGLRMIGGTREESVARSQILGDLKRNLSLNLARKGWQTDKIEGEIERLLAGEDD